MTFDNFIIFVYFFLICLYYASYLLLYFKVLNSSHYVYFYQLNNLIQFLIAVFLLIRYHPFKTKYDLLKSDGYLIFASACFLLINLGIVHFFTDWFWKQYEGKGKPTEVIR